MQVYGQVKIIFKLPFHIHQQREKAHKMIINKSMMTKSLKGREALNMLNSDVRPKNQLVRLKILLCQRRFLTYQRMHARIQMLLLLEAYVLVIFQRARPSLGREGKEDLTSLQLKEKTMR